MEFKKNKQEQIKVLKINIKFQDEVVERIKSE